MNDKKYIITFSYGDCSCGVGGTDKMVLTQIHLLNDAEYNVVSLSPNRGKYGGNYWDVLVNGHFYGVFSTERFKRLIFRWKCDIYTIIVHHLKGIKIDLLEKIIDYVNVPILFYLHDYYTICPNGGLVRENGEYCGTGFPNADKCKNCSLFNDVIRKLEIYKKFFEKYKERITYVIPSDAAKEIWVKHYPEYKDNLKVIYHQKLYGEYLENREIIEDNEPLKIAFIGYQKNLKGWIQFKEAAIKAIEDDRNIKFYQFGWGDEKIDGIEQVIVDFKKNINAMIDALRSNKIHIAILWSIWPETYAYTYYEAYSANCFIITNNRSGNIFNQVELRNNGIVVDDLKSFLNNEQELRGMLNKYRKTKNKIPLSLEENKDFLSLIPKGGVKVGEASFKIDLSFIYSVVKKIKRFL